MAESSFATWTILLRSASLALAAQATHPGMVRIPGTRFVMGAGELEPQGRDALEQQVRRAECHLSLSL